MAAGMALLGPWARPRPLLLRVLMRVLLRVVLEGVVLLRRLLLQLWWVWVVWLCERLLLDLWLQVGPRLRGGTRHA